MKECRIIIINEESGELLKNELIEEELADQITGIVEDGFVDTYEQCETICSNVSKMLEEAGIEADEHEEMIDALEDLKLVKKKLFEMPKIEEKTRKTKEKVIKPRKIIRKKKIECECD